MLYLADNKLWGQSLSMKVVITEWALQSYLELKHRRVFSELEYKETLRPDAELLRTYPEGEKFKNNKFWSPASNDHEVLNGGYKMKWHNVGDGKVQLRLLVAITESTAFLCEAYVKHDEKVDRRFMAKMKMRLREIAKGSYVTRGEI